MYLVFANWPLGLKYFTVPSLLQRPKNSRQLWYNPYLDTERIRWAFLRLWAVLCEIKHQIGTFWNWTYICAFAVTLLILFPSSLIWSQWSLLHIYSPSLIYIYHPNFQLFFSYRIFCSYPLKSQANKTRLITQIPLWKTFLLRLYLSPTLSFNVQSGEGNDILTKTKKIWH